MFEEIVNAPRVVMGERDDGDKNWIFALVIIFLGLLFLMRRDRHEGGGYGYGNMPMPVIPINPYGAGCGPNGNRLEDKMEHTYQDKMLSDIYAQEYGIKEKVVDEARRTENTIFQSTLSTQKEIQSVKDQMANDRMRALETENGRLHNELFTSVAMKNLRDEILAALPIQKSMTSHGTFAGCAPAGCAPGWA